MSIKSYSCKPNSNFVGKDLWGIYMGVELELEVDSSDTRSECSELVLGKLGDFAITKEDGSLDYGFEICSSPASLDKHKEKWEKFFVEDVVSNFESRTTCGMHVHVSREPLSTLQIGKIIEFVHNPSNYSFIKIVAERGSGMYNQYKDCAKKITDVSKYSNRRLGVNLSNPQTIEFRLFKSPTKKLNFYKNLEFCYALVKFTFPSSSSMKDTKTVDGFIKFLEKNSREYPNLCQFLSERGYSQLERKVNKKAA